MSCKLVAKFGGTSVKTPQAIENLGKIVKSQPSIRVVMVSAVGGVTNLLLEFCKEKREKRRALIDQMVSRHRAIIEELRLPLTEGIDQGIERLKELESSSNLDLQGIDSVLSVGEDLSSLIVTAYLRQQGLEATHLDARRFMITDDHFGKAVPQLSAIKSYPFPEGLTVTQGFIGATVKGLTTTLGRGGSDYSAALIAEAIGADELLIYTDVPGVYSMDPNALPEARPIPSLSFQEVAEMANFGAKVLHPATIEPCVRAKIPIRILSTFEPEKEGTVITSVQAPPPAGRSLIRAITMRPNQVLVTIQSTKMLDCYGFLANIFNILARHKISVDLITTSEIKVALTIDETSIGSHSSNPFIKNHDLLKELEAFAEIQLEEELTLIAVIGYGLRSPGVMQTILNVLAPYKIRSICYGASNSSVGILVNKNDAEYIAILLHHRLIGGRHV